MSVNCYWPYIYIVVARFKRGRGVLITTLTPQHFSACPKSEISCLYVLFRFHFSLLFVDGVYEGNHFNVLVYVYNVYSEPAAACPVKSEGFLVDHWWPMMALHVFIAFFIPVGLFALWQIHSRNICTTCYCKLLRKMTKKKKTNIYKMYIWYTLVQVINGCIWTHCRSVLVFTAKKKIFSKDYVNSSLQ